ncbi:unnamed protein product [Phytophthora fragariaefolia]|uniref:Unnamed protein product n=1 Tax=Phytophthora fragariaefolia TaxID=1490495 RepID=A0A9W6XHM7_9STRA|nr:unnamed protein product [Phytophthora fragariaefolia]
MAGSGPSVPISESTASPQSPPAGLQDQTAYQLGEIQNLEPRLTRMARERDCLQASNDHLAAEMDLAGADILDLLTEYADIERDLEDSEEQRRILESSLDRVQAALQRAEEERPRAPDPVVRPRSPSLLIQERDRALASAAEAEARVVQIRGELESRQQSYMNTVSELSCLRAVHNVTLVDLDREVAARTSSDRAAEVARMELSDLQGSLESSEETVDALGQRVREIQDQRQAADIVGASPRPRPEDEDPTALLRPLREDPADTYEHPTPRYLTYGDPLETPPKNVDPHNLPDPMTPAASKRPREDSNTPDPNSAPPAKRRFTSQDPVDAKDDHSLSDPTNQGGEIDDDGGRISEDHEEGGYSVSDEATTRGGAGSGAEGEDTETAEVADEPFEAQTLEALSQSRSAERRRQHASPSRRSSMGGSGGPPGGSDDSDSEEDPDPQGHGRDPATPPRPRNPLAAADPFAPGDQCIPGRDRSRILVPIDCEPWAVTRLNHVAIMTMSIEVLFPLLPTQPGWIFPHLDPENRPQYRSTDYCSDLVTEVNVRALLDTRPWDTLEGTDNMISFEADVGGRLGLLIQAYRDFETSALMSYWESTHSFPIPDSAVRRDPWLGGWCDLDIMLDPFFLHFSKRVETVTWYPGVDSRQANLSGPNLHHPEPTDLLEALDECNTEDPWRNHYRDTPQYHPARQIARIPAKFYNLRAVGSA